MLTIIICVLIMAMPLTGLAFLRSALLRKQLPFMVLLAIGMMVFAFGLVTTYAAMLVWISSAGQHGGLSLSYVRLFIPVGILINLCGISYMLFIRKK